MANKKTIQQLEIEIDSYWRKLLYATRQINERRDLIKKIRMGKVKQPPPKGKKVTLAEVGFTKKRDFNVDDFDDDLPSFGGNPNTSFD